MENRVFTWLEKENPNHLPMVISVSGGVDSMALLFMLHAMSLPLVCVHFNHLTRPENLQELEMVKAFCQKCHITFHTTEIRVVAGNFQNEARNLRHRYLKHIADIYHTPYILTAHHLDDLAETMLMTISRGNSLTNIAGFNPRLEKNGYIFLKPLYFVSKKDLIDYADRHQIPYMNDASNGTLDYFRNRVRHQILPLFKEESPRFLNHMLDLNHQISQSTDYINKQTRNILNGSTSIKNDVYIHLHTVIQKEILICWFKDFEIPITNVRIQELHKLLCNHSLYHIHLRDNLYLIKSYHDISIERLSDITPVLSEFKENTHFITENETVCWSFDNNNVSLNKKIVKLCYNEITFPLLIRTRKPGDMLSFPFGRKKLKDFLIDQKVARHLRDSLLVVTDANNTLLWIPNLYLNTTLGNNHSLYFQIGGSENES